MNPFKGQQLYLTVSLFIVSILASVVICSGAQPQDPLQELYKAAKGEKELVWQWSESIDGIRPVIDAFHAKFPDIKLSAISIGSATIGSRIITEASTGKLTVDVATISAVYIAPLLERDLLAKYNWTKILPNVSPTRLGYDGGYIFIADAGKMWAYNTKLVSKAEAPKTLEDTLDPKWKGGKISLRAAHSGFINVWPLWKQNRQKAVEYMKRLVKQDFLPEMRTAVVSDRIVRGECPIGMPRVSDVFRASKDGAPLAPCPIKPAVAYPTGIFIPKGGVKHPNAAKLFMAWMLTPEGMTKLGDAGGGILYPPEASDAAKWLANNNLSLMRIASKEDIQEYNRDFAEMVMKETGFKPD
jgi:iron(III) transport system substrate-binding protein